MQTLPLRDAVTGLKKQLASGSHGSVYNTETGVAKIIDIAGLSENDGVVTRAIMEVEVLKALQHPNIVEYLESYRTPDSIVILTNRADCGDLAMQIENRSATGRRFSSLEVLLICTQIAMAVQAVHQAGFAHNDVKPTNIFLNKTGVLQIGDFGVSTSLGNTHIVNEAATLRGTPYYLPPEVWLSILHETDQFTSPKTDIWSMGVVMFETSTLTRPFKADDVEELADRVIEADFDENLVDDGEVLGVLSRMLEKNPEERPDIAAILSLGYFQRGLRAFDVAVRQAPAITDDVKNCFAKHITELIQTKAAVTHQPTKTDIVQKLGLNGNVRDTLLSVAQGYLTLSPVTERPPVVAPKHSLVLTDVLQVYPTPSPCVFGLDTKSRKTHLFKVRTEEDAANWVDTISTALEFHNVDAA
eukprot:TRINITY_DN2566_c3_g1_i1.p1 TRINITY_DN2566_c3_g1~~TRINITY_DN2566_c3_g1_i1.p1  ORF type:complete len:415 (+),score=63.00 TRINITY_DN2566_c3_g1_i1:45-1289(+)